MPGRVEHEAVPGAERREEGGLDVPGEDKLRFVEAKEYYAEILNVFSPVGSLCANDSQL